MEMKAVPSVASLYSKGFYLSLATVMAGVLQVCSSAETEDGFPFKRGESEIFGTRELQSTSLSSLTHNIDPDEHNCTLQQRLEVGFRRTGSEIRKNTAKNALNCATLCLFAVGGCKAVNYNTETQMCFLLDEPGYIIADSDFTTALIDPEPADLCNTNNFILNTNSPGRSLPGSPFSVKTAEDCCFKCYATPECISFVYGTYSHNCYLKSQTDAMIPTEGAVVSLMCPSSD